MKISKVWDIQVWDGGSMHYHKYYVSTKEAADEWMKNNTYDYIQEKEMIVINSQGVLFIVGMPEYYPYVILLSDRVKSYEVVWK